MCVGDIVFFPEEGGFIKYIIKKIVQNEILVISYKTRQFNWLNVSDVIGLDDFIKVYKNERIFE